MLSLVQGPGNLAALGLNTTSTSLKPVRLGFQAPEALVPVKNAQVRLSPVPLPWAKLLPAYSFSFSGVRSERGKVSAG